jgi:GntR family transcriptional regulator
MDFASGEAIYLQIADLVCENIILGKWAQGERIPSVRDMAVDLEVNPNTVMRAYSHLQGRDIIENRRGIGYFVSGGALDRARRKKRREFLDRDLPALFRNMEVLGVDIDELEEEYRRYGGRGRDEA